MILLSAPNQVTETYALQLWASRPNKNDYIEYGILQEKSETRRGIKRALEINDLIDTFNPRWSRRRSPILIVSAPFHL